MKSSTLGSVKFVWMSLDRRTRSIFLLQMDRTPEDRLQGKRRSSHGTNYLINLYDIVYLASFGIKFITDHKIAFWSDSVDCFDACQVRRLIKQTILT